MMMMMMMMIMIIIIIIINVTIGRIYERSTAMRPNNSNNTRHCKSCRQLFLFIATTFSTP